MGVNKIKMNDSFIEAAFIGNDEVDSIYSGTHIVYKKATDFSKVKMTGFADGVLEPANAGTGIWRSCMKTTTWGDWNYYSIQDQAYNSETNTYTATGRGYPVNTAYLIVQGAKVVSVSNTASDGVIEIMSEPPTETLYYIGNGVVDYDSIPDDCTWIKVQCTTSTSRVAAITIVLE